MMLEGVMFYGPDRQERRHNRIFIHMITADFWYEKASRYQMPYHVMPCPLAIHHAAPHEGIRFWMDGKDNRQHALFLA
jgi:hypothetical protein